MGQKPKMPKWKNNKKVNNPPKPKQKPQFRYNIKSALKASHTLYINNKLLPFIIAPE